MGVRPVFNYKFGIPAPPKEKSLDISRLDGGLNTWELDYRIGANQSPDMENMYWVDGALGSRKGQDFLMEEPFPMIAGQISYTVVVNFVAADTVTICGETFIAGTDFEIGEDIDASVANLAAVLSETFVISEIYDVVSALDSITLIESEPGGGNNPTPASFTGTVDIESSQVIESSFYNGVYACYGREFQRKGIVHAGTRIYSVDLDTGEKVNLYSGVTPQGGTFFAFAEKLYYLNGAEYLVIEPDLSVSPVEPYIPVVAMNRNPDGSGGDLYQPENRLSAGKTIWFTADGTSDKYYLPYKSLDATTVVVTVDGVELTEGEDFEVDRTLGVVTFDAVPTKADPPILNGVKITCFKADEDTQNSILSCRVATVFGGDTDLAVVVGGPTKQPNAYFWSGSHTVLDPTYFPFDYYNFAGSDATEYITGFGRQQGMLIIFKERSIGKAYSLIETIDEKDYMSLPYTLINDRIGCNLPGTIKLIMNNLIFCNTEVGPCVLMDTTSAGENTVSKIGRNINGTDERPGLLEDVRAVSAAAVSSFDDGQRYWIMANEHAYLWDYGISGYRSDEANIVWFYFTNIKARCWIKRDDDWFYGTMTGDLVKPSDQYADFGDAITRRFKFATQFFNTYEVFKDIIKVIFSVRSDTNTVIQITYDTDYGVTEDLTPIQAYSNKLVPRNLVFRILSVTRYASVHIRTPQCFHVRHFSMTLTNNVVNTDMSLVGAQIFYRFSGGDR